MHACVKYSCYHSDTNRSLHEERDFDGGCRGAEWVLWLLVHHNFLHPDGGLLRGQFPAERHFDCEFVLGFWNGAVLPDVLLVQLVVQHPYFVHVDSADWIVYRLSIFDC